MAYMAQPWGYAWSTGPASLQGPRAHAVRYPTRLKQSFKLRFAQSVNDRIAISSPRGRGTPVSRPIAYHNCLLIILVPGGDRPAFVSYDVFLW